MLKILAVLWVVFFVMPLDGKAQLTLIKNGRSNYKIIIAAKPTAIQKQAALVLQKYLKKISGAQLPVLTDRSPVSSFEIRVGPSGRSGIRLKSNLAIDALMISSTEKTLFLNGGKGKGVLYSVYTFLEKYLGCRKFTADSASVPLAGTILIPEQLLLSETPAISFREVYYPASENQEYLDWHKLSRRDESWGLWVHTFDKLLPAKVYYKKHPEYYALVDGRRQATQLCLSNPDVLKLLGSNLRQKMSSEPDKKYWSVSQNDGLGYCECIRCRAVDDREGGPQGSIVNFVNKVARKFPDKIISTLAYTYSRKAPKHIKPEDNVLIMFSSIDCNRGRPIASDPRSANFRHDFQDWARLTNHLFIWDYVVQFTNYQSPFPNLNTLQANMKYFKSKGVEGLFEQGSGESKSEFAELKSYLLAKLCWDPRLDVGKLTADFLRFYYGAAAPLVKQYIDLLHQKALASNRYIDIYGSPVKEFNSYLTPELIDQYGSIFDRAEKMVEKEPVLFQHVKELRLPVEFAVLQQSKFYGIEKFGAFVQADNGSWVPRQGLPQRIARFTSMCKEFGIQILAEDGLTPDQYQNDWNEVFKLGPKYHDAINATVAILTPFSTDYPNKRAHTLTDGSRGYYDFQYNWLGWYGDNMAVKLDLGVEKEISKVGLSFLEDQRHWAFLPTNIIIETSADDEHYAIAGKLTNPAIDEDYTVVIKNNILNLDTPVKGRYIKITAYNLKKLPVWRAFKGRKPWLFADEVMVN